MPLDRAAALKQIDDVLARCPTSLKISDELELSKSLSLILSAIRRLAPHDSIYANNVEGYERYLTSGALGLITTLEPARGMLQALRSDYESGYLQSVVELVHADIFADFLEMADYLLQQGYKDPAAVVTGSVLEEHLRKLCAKHNVDIVKTDGSPKKADSLNSDLSAAGAYSKLDLKNVTAWLDLRNKAAHGLYTQYTQEQVALMLQGARDFVLRHPA
jgi:hypothetical protein